MKFECPTCKSEEFFVEKYDNFVMMAGEFFKIPEFPPDEYVIECRGCQRRWGEFKSEEQVLDFLEDPEWEGCDLNDDFWDAEEDDD